MAATAPANFTAPVAPSSRASTSEKRGRTLVNGVRIPAAEYEYDLAGPSRSKTRFKGMDGVVFDVFDEAACVSGCMAAVIRSKDPSMPADYAYPLSNVQSGVLETVLEYCYFHASTTRAAISDYEADEWDDEFASLDPRQLCELASAAYYLDIKALVDLTCKTIAGMISGKSADEIRSTFHIENDLDGDFLGVLPSEWYSSGSTRGNRFRTRLLTVERHAKRLNKTRALRSAEETVQPENEAIASASVEEIMNYIDGGKPNGSQKSSGKRRRGKKKRAQSPDRSSESQNGESKSRENSTPPDGSDTASPPATPPNRPPAIEMREEEKGQEPVRLDHNTKDVTLVTSPTTPEPKREESVSSDVCKPDALSTPMEAAAAPAETRSSKRARQRARKKDRKRAAAAGESMDRASTEESTASHESNGAPQNFADEFDEEALHHMDEEVEAFARKLIMADNEANEKKRVTLQMQLQELQNRAAEIDTEMANLAKEREAVRDKLARTQIELANVPLPAPRESISGL